ncbi:MAG: coproporphyrinogen dehydrogenase HemZ [Clostridiaceae bacterium]|nr:coproporphyrinogen dehydrogenase HemZ [Clostridiaceae bacterium]
MSDSNNPIIFNKVTKDVLVEIEGIVMDQEAWELLRLFYDSECIHFTNAISNIDSIQYKSFPGNFEESSSRDYLFIKVFENDEFWSCQVCLYTDISLLLTSKSKPDFFSEKTVYYSDLEKPGGKLFQRRKIIVGSCIVKVMTKYTGKKLPYGSLLGVRPVKLAMQCVNDKMDKDETVNHLIKLSDIDSKKAELLYNIAVTEKPFLQDDKKAIHLYVGIPFCASRCLYCSFTAYPIHRYKKLVPSYILALSKEIQHTAKWINQNDYHISSIYIGGGTPTSVDSSDLDRILGELTANFNLKNCEFTVEAGRPDTITKDKLEIMAKYKVNRISINPQTMNEETLRIIGRNHTPEDIIDKYYLARDLGFDNINMDIIAGLPNEDIDMFINTLEKIEEMQPDSLTVHTMALKRASRLREEKSRYLSTPDMIVEAMIEEARKSAYKMGMRSYYLYRQKNILANLENTGYSKPGYECRYNIHTMEEIQTIVALGAGAISKFVNSEKNEINRVFNLKDVDLYISKIDEMLKRKEVYLNHL